MTVRLIASAVIAALLLFGIIPSASQTPGTGFTATHQQPAAEQVTPLTAEEAEAFALRHAGLTAEEVSALHSHQDLDDRIDHWDVEFQTGNWEFDYEISLTGEILEWDKDYERSANPKTDTPAAADPNAVAGITDAEAIQTALAHAGLTASQVHGLRAELDYEDGVTVYDVQFRADGYEYEYEIDAKTGKIREWDKDWDD